MSTIEGYKVKKYNYLITPEEIKELQNWIPLDFKFGNWANCFYCGDIPNSQDHIIPWSMINSIEKHSGSDKGPRTPSCMVCNGILSSFFFDSLHERCEYVKQYLLKKHSKLLKIKDWSEKDLKEIDGKLKNHVIRQLNLKKEMMPRIFWQNSKEFVSEFDKAYQKAINEYPFNKYLHKFMTPSWVSENCKSKTFA